MADRAIVKIEVSDSDDRFRMKVNQNFQQLSRGLVIDGPLRQAINESFEIDPQTIIGSVFEIVCPVGTIIFTGSMADPRLQRGTWRRIENKFILAASSSHMLNTTGGEETVALTAANNGTHTHTASAGAVPSHSHDITILSNGLHNHTATVQSDGSHSHTATTATAGAHGHTLSIASGGAHLHNFERRSDLTYYGSDEGAAAGVGIGTHTGDVAYQTTTNGEHGHSATASNAGAHRHSVTVNSSGSHAHSATTNEAGSHEHTATASTVEGVSGDITIDASGSGTAHENMPPYVSKYCFERIA